MSGGGKADHCLFVILNIINIITIYIIIIIIHNHHDHHNHSLFLVFQTLKPMQKRERGRLETGAKTNTFGHCLRKDEDDTNGAFPHIFCSWHPSEILYMAPLPLPDILKATACFQHFALFLLCYAQCTTGVIVEKHNFINGRQPAARHLRPPSAFALLP